MERPSILERYRRPEYTGENRCPLCTAVNLLLGVVIAMSVAVLVRHLGGAARVALVVEGLVLAGAIGQIWLRGYLLPGTPTVTTQYLPARVLGWFGKE